MSTWVWWTPCSYCNANIHVSVTPLCAHSMGSLDSLQSILWSLGEKIPWIHVPQAGLLQDISKNHEYHMALFKNKKELKHLGWTGLGAILYIFTYIPKFQLSITDLFIIFNFNYNNFVLIVFDFNSSSDKFQLNSYDCILKMMLWLSSTCTQNFPSSLVFILEIDNYLKHTMIALFRQYITKIVWLFGQRYFLDTWWNKSLILYKFLFQQASLSYLKTGVIPHSNNNQHWAFNIHSFRSSDAFMHQ